MVIAMERLEKMSQNERRGTRQLLLRFVVKVIQLAFSHTVRPYISLRELSFINVRYLLITGGGYGNPLQYSCTENSMDRGTWDHKVSDMTKAT